MNGSRKSRAHRDDGADGETDTVTLSSQLKLNKGDTVWVKFHGHYYYPADEHYAFFEGHLTREINS